MIFIPYLQRTMLLSLIVIFGSALEVVNAAQKAVEADPLGEKSILLAQSDVSTEVYLLVQQLQQEVRELRGQIEELNYRVNQSSKQERERYLDLDRRILELSKSRPQKTVVPAQSPADQQANNTARQTTEQSVGDTSQTAADEYARAYDLIKQRRYDEAVVALHRFINDNPESGLTPNAYYWLGEVYLVIPKLEQARQAFVVVIGKYPKHRKAADAYFKLGVTYHRLGDTDEAQTYLRQTIEKYPETSAANLAKDYLAKI